MGVLFLNSQFYNNKNIEKRILLCYDDTVAFCFSISNVGGILMKEIRKDLQPFNLAQLNEIRKIRAENHYRWGDQYETFWKELEIILSMKNYYKNAEWVKMQNDEVVLGDVWSRPIGNFNYRHTVHEFNYLYVETQGLAIAKHGHQAPANGGKQIRKIKEWYVFPDGTIELCRKDEKHSLVNNFGKPIFVLSIKSYSNGTR